VEAEITVDVELPSVRGFESRVHVRDRRVHLGQVRLRAALGRERRRFAFEDAPKLVDLVHARLVEREQELERGVERVAEVRHGERRVANGLDQPLRFEHAQCFAHGRASRAVALRQLTFGRQDIAGSQPPRGDLRDELLCDELVDLASLYRLERWRAWSDRQTIARRY
jgi:hypothetical protein